MAGIPQNLLEDILNRVNIVEVIAACLPLKRSGRNFKALCPFHQEKTPSFMVSPDRQIYHCFSCGKGGNAFKFLMEYERLEFMEAVEALAKKAGVALPKAQAQDEKTANLITQLYKINELAAAFYASNLSSAAKNYLLKRGIKEETIKLFKMGLALDKWDGLMQHLRQKNINLSLLEKAGLILSKEGGGFYDRFRNRIIIPILDIKDRAIGFGARVLDNSLPKYINSPETPIYTKGRNLYGLNLAHEEIRQKDFAVVVEGYLDFIIPYQEGLKNIVASQGTALTQEQARLLKRYTDNVVMLYDADKAGELASLRSLDIFIEEEMNVRVVSLPQGFDPDLFVRNWGIKELQEKIGRAEGLFDYKLKILKSRYNVKEIEARAKIAQEMLLTINKFKNALLKSEYIRRLAEELGLKEEALLEEVKKIKEPRAIPGPLQAQSVKNRLKASPTERLLIKMMLEDKESVNRIKENLGPEDFQDETASRIVSAMFNFIEQGKKIDSNTLIEHLSSDDGVAEVICEAAFMDVAGNDRERVVDNCIERLKSEGLKIKRQRLHEQIKAAQHSGDEPKVNRLIQEFHRLIKKEEIKNA